MCLFKKFNRHRHECHLMPPQGKQPSEGIAEFGRKL